MKNIVLKATSRQEVSNQVKKLREENKIPAVVYGHGLATRNLTLDYLAFEKLYHSTAGSGLVDLEVDNGQPIKVLVQDFQLDPFTSRFTHVDLRQVKMDEKIKTQVKLNFVGESPAVKESGANLIKNLSEVPVECLPQDLVNEINVDLSVLKVVGNAIHVKDLVAPNGVKILSHANDVVASVTLVKIEEEAPVAAAAADLTQIKTEGEVKKEAKAAEEAAAKAVETDAKAGAEKKDAGKKEAKK